MADEMYQSGIFGGIKETVVKKKSGVKPKDRRSGDVEIKLLQKDVEVLKVLGFSTLLLMIQFAVLILLLR